MTTVKIPAELMEESLHGLSELQAILVCAQALAEADQPRGTLSMGLLHIACQMHSYTRPLENALERALECGRKNPEGRADT